MGLVRSYSKINRSAKEEAANGDDRREKSWFTKKGSGVLLGDEDGNEEEERTRRTGPAIYVSISWRARVRRDSHPGWTADGGLVRRGHLPAESNPLRSSVPLSCILTSRTEWGPRRCTRRPNPFSGERTPTAFSRYASRPR
ncbi:hypothetical protein ALC60_08867 [Trachymyrmex zeteki]|uniref:Uncharacterized protein n=1 Tax=Mycetomoellerius zeteki TaxID=64791 RepID=A0A151WWH5_9HYME|nr:hypothetical protein ALC60_08867 [Trachymyrmex zeteki]